MKLELESKTFFFLQNEYAHVSGEMATIFAISKLYKVPEYRYNCALRIPKAWFLQHDTDKMPLFKIYSPR